MYHSYVPMYRKDGAQSVPRLTPENLSNANQRYQQRETQKVNPKLRLNGRSSVESQPCLNDSTAGRAQQRTAPAKWLYTQITREEKLMDELTS